MSYTKSLYIVNPNFIAIRRDLQAAASVILGCMVSMSLRLGRTHDPLVNVRRSPIITAILFVVSCSHPLSPFKPDGDKAD